MKNTKFKKGNDTREVLCLNPGAFAQMLLNKAIVIGNITRGRDKSRMVIVRKGQYIERKEEGTFSKGKAQVSARSDSL